MTRRPTDNRLVVKFAVNKLEDDKAVPTCVTEEIVCDMAFRSIGYKGKRLFSELPFDEATGVIPNKNGRIMPGNRKVDRSFHLNNDNKIQFFQIPKTY